MPKQKTRKGVAKRLKQTGTGKFKHARAGKRHILTKKSPKRKARLKKSALIRETEISAVKAALPYGLR